MVAVVAFGVLASLVGAALLGALSSGDTPGGNQATPLGSVAPAPLQPGVVADTVAALARFVESERQLVFQQVPGVEVVGDTDFVRRLSGAIEPDVEALAERGRVAGTLGLVGPGEQPVEGTLALLATSALGFYDTTTGDIVVRGTELDVLVQRTIVHELTHALDDQWFDLDRPPGFAFTDAGLGLASVAEASALRVEQRWVDRLDAVSEAELRRLVSVRTQQLETTGVPWAMADWLTEPYLRGPPFIDAVVATAGSEGLDVALGDPPVSSAEILHPGLYVQGFVPAAVAVPPAGGEPVAEGVLGELMLRQALSGAVTLPVATAAAGVWRGDAYVGWVDDTGQRCTRVDIVTEASLRRVLADAVDQWVSTLVDASWETVGNEVVRVTSCVPDDPPAAQNLL